MAGEFPFPVKYGYATVGRIEHGPAERLGRMAFTLHPVQTLFNIPASAAIPLPEDVPPQRAVLAANMETALNAVWDAGAAPGDRILVVGAGIVGLLVAALAARIPGADVTVTDIDAGRAALVESLGARFLHPLPGDFDADIVVHASASAAGLETAIAAAGMEAVIIELSWYGDRAVPVRLGGAFHSRRLRLQSSQVGQLPPARRPRWDYRRRLEAALNLLRVPALDALVADEIAFADAASALPRVLAADSRGLPPVIRYQTP
jgi:threonine dehydrogenase-like Zn-dependent dehydrogenase